MQMFDVQGVEIHAPIGRVFEFLRNPVNLPQWARAFKSVEHGRARLETPAGALDVGLRTRSDGDAGTVDWQLDFPDGSVSRAHSRVVDSSRGSCIYCFVLHAPPVALEQLEGALEAQRAILREELVTLKALMERG